MRAPKAATPRPPESPFYDQAEAAAFLRLGARTLEDYRRKGTGPAFCKLGDRVIYDRADLEQWARATRRKSTTDEPGAGVAAPH